MDAWGGIIGAMKSSDQGRSLEFCEIISMHLTSESCLTSALRRVYLPITQWCICRSEPQRGFNEVVDGCYWVSQTAYHNMSLFNNLLGISQTPFPTASSLSIIGPIG